MTRTPQCWAWASGRDAWDDAAHELAERAARWCEPLAGPPFIVLASTPHHARRLPDLAARVQQASGGLVVACVSPGVAVAGHNLARGAALGAFGVAGFAASCVTLEELVDAPRDAFGGAPGPQGPPDLAGVFLLGDASSTPTVRLLPAISASLGTCPVLGALLPAREGDAPPVAIADDAGARSISAGVAVALRGNASCTPMLAQGCRPVGPARSVTKARGTLVLDLDDAPALPTLQRAAGAEDLRGWCLALIPGEDAGARPGRDDVVVREIRGQDAQSGGVALPEPIADGTRVQLHRPDGAVAAADLELLLDVQRLREPPLGALLVRSLDRPGAMVEDARRVGRAFAPPTPGPERARAGRPVDPDARPFPALAIGSAAEIARGRAGPRVHALAACAWLVRPMS
ncbi:MAG: FIST N-terminal domain-containing protein [Planctomycetota bacterium]